MEKQSVVVQWEKRGEMKEKEKKVIIAGAGVMGASIAQVFAGSGYEVVLYDVKGDALAKGRELIHINQKAAKEEGYLTEAECEERLGRICFCESIECFQLADFVIEAIIEKRHIEVADYGCYNGETVDFPDIARKVCTSVTQGEAERGIMLCGSGVGAAIACNKVPGIRAACCHDIYTAHQCVEHDDVNVIALGADVVGGQAACDLIYRYLDSRFSGGEEFKRRISKLDQMDAEKQKRNQ